LTPTRPNILLIVLDALRADHVSSYSYERLTTPTLDELARDGVLFSQAISCAPWTLPSHVSMFTGLNPGRHGATQETLYLSSTVPVIAELLQTAFRYRTMAFVHNDWITSLTGLCRGFQEFHSHKYSIRPDQRQGRARLHRIWRYGRRKLARLMGEPVPSNCEAKVDAICSRLETYRSSSERAPWFVFAHFMEPHRPWRPPARFVKKVTGINPNRSDRKLSTTNAGIAYTGNKLKLSASELERSVALYDGEIAYVDYALKPLLTFLETNDLMDNTLIIVTSDHGENLGEYGLMGHRFCLYDSLLRVPLIIRYPTYFENGQIFNGQVQTSDIFHTILHILGVSEGEFRFQSQNSLLTMLHDNLGKSFAFAEYARPIVALSVLKSRTGVYASKFDTALSCVRTPTHKLIRAHNHGTSELYDLATDPVETQNLILEQPQVAASLNQVLDDFLRDSKACKEQEPSADVFGDVAPEVYRRLRDLGYVE
jgi:arylsulfatase A-like enzyme